MGSQPPISLRVVSALFGLAIFGMVFVGAYLVGTQPHRISLFRICPSGERIYLYDNGKYGISGLAGWIENPETICR